LEKSYLTIQNNTRTEIVEKKSRFIATVQRCETEEDALRHINKVRAKYPDARHNVYAYSVLKDGVNAKKYSDDGEPKGTAGMPILECIQKLDVTNVCVVVTRYFGGILLGASGLTRTYSNSANEGLKASGIIKMELSQEINVTVTYDMYGRVTKIFEKYDIIKDEPIFGTDVSIKIFVKTDDVDKIVRDIRDATSNNFSYELLNVKYCEFLA